MSNRLNAAGEAIKTPLDWRHALPVIRLGQGDMDRRQRAAERRAIHDVSVMNKPRPRLADENALLPILQKVLARGARPRESGGR